MLCKAIIATSVLIGSGFPTHAEGNLASKPVDLPDLILKSDLTISQSEYMLETGKYYRLHISSDGEEGFAWMAAELFRNSWVDQIAVNGLKVKSYGTYSLEFDDASTFVPIRPGRYDFWVDGYENRGMKGAFMVN